MSLSTSKPGSRKTVAFSIQSDEDYIVKPPLERSRWRRQSRSKMANKFYQKFNGDQVTDDMMQEASKLFSENYGIWGKEAANTTGAFAKEGKLI